MSEETKKKRATPQKVFPLVVTEGVLNDLEVLTEATGRSRSEIVRELIHLGAEAFRSWSPESKTLRERLKDVEKKRASS